MKYSPKRKKATGRFDFCVEDDTKRPIIWEPFGHCKTFWDKGNKDGHHDSPISAVECFLSFVLEEELDYRGVLIYLLPCAACQEKTLNCVTREQQLFMVLCRDHATPDTIRQLLRKHMSYEVVPEYAEDKTDPVVIPNVDIPGAFHEAVRNRSNKSKRDPEAS